MNDRRESHPTSLIRRFWEITRSPYVVWGGIPTAIIAAAWSQFGETGYVWSSLWSGQFLLRLVISIVITGYGLGLMMRAVIRRAAARLGMSLRDGWR